MIKLSFPFFGTLFGFVFCLQMSGCSPDKSSTTESPKPVQSSSDSPKQVEKQEGAVTKKKPV
jgi:hypothetical protein